MKTLYVLVTSARPDVYTNVIAHALSSSPGVYESIKLVSVSEHNYAEDHERVTKILRAVIDQFTALAEGRYVVDPETWLDLGEDAAGYYARCYEKLNSSSPLSSDVVPFHSLDERLGQYIAAGPCIFDVSALKNNLLVDVVTLLLSRGFTHIYNFELTVWPAPYDQHGLIHDLRQGEDYIYRCLAESGPVRLALSRIKERALSFRTGIFVTVVVALVVAVLQVFVSAHWLTTIFVVLAVVTGVVSVLLWFVGESIGSRFKS